MYQFASEPLTISKIYKNAFSLYRATISKIWRIVFLGMISLFIANIIFLGIGIIQSGNMDYLKAVIATGAPASFSIRISTSTDPWLGILLLVGIITLLMIKVYFANVALHRIYILGNNMTETLKDSFAFVWHKFLRLILATILAMISIFIIIILLSLIINIVPYYITLGFKLLLLLFLAIVLAVFVSFYSPLILFENKKIHHAIGSSIKLVWGRWWQSLTALIPSLFPLLLVTLIQMITAKLISNVFAVNNIVLNFTIYVSILIIIYTIVLPLRYAFLLVQYRNLRLRKPQ